MRRRRSEGEGDSGGIVDFRQYKYRMMRDRRGSSGRIKRAIKRHCWVNAMKRDDASAAESFREAVCGRRRFVDARYGDDSEMIA